MNNKFCKALGAIVVAVLLLAPALALGEARFPIDRGAVTDDANVLSQEMVAQIQEFQSVAESRTGVKVRVAVVHFLDGLDAQAYASKLFTRWNMGEEDFLLLGAAGEDSYGIASGQEMKRSFSDNNAQLMLSSSGFGEQFKDQQYDAAFGKFFVAFGQMLGRQYSVDMGLDKLFTAYQSGASVAQVPTPTPTNGSFFSSMWDIAMDRSDDIAMGYADYHERREQEEGGLTPAGWVLMAVLILIVFSQSDPARKARKGGGCGCGPIGWIFALFGLFGIRKKH